MIENANYATQIALKNRRITKAIEHLLGMVTGMVVDGHLHDLEIRLLSTWLRENAETCEMFPASVIARKVRDVLADGVITDNERTHLLGVLTSLATTDFGSTGSATPEVTSLPIEDLVTVEFSNAMVCMTGEFIYGTRAACERLVLRAGAMCSDSVSKKVDILVVGTRVSPDWALTSLGRKIQKAVELQEHGHPIEIISERRMLQALGGIS